MRTVVALGAFLFAVVGCGSGAAQKSRDDWKYPPLPLRKVKVVYSTLEDAEISTEEWDEIYKDIERGVRTSGYAEADEDVPAAVLSTWVGLVGQPKSGRQLITVQGPPATCSPMGNCLLAVFLWQKGKLLPVLGGPGKGIIVRDHSHRGFPDIALTFRESMGVASYLVYRWDKTEYKTIDCYVVTERGEPVVVESCPGTQR